MILNMMIIMMNFIRVWYDDQNYIEDKNDHDSDSDSNMNYMKYTRCSIMFGLYTPAKIQVGSNKKCIDSNDVWTF